MFDEAVRVDGITVGFRYFDPRDLLGFVDDPVGADVVDAVFVQADDSAAAGGSYVVIPGHLS